MTVQELIDELEKTPEHLRNNEVMQASGEYTIYDVEITEYDVTIR